MLDEPRELDEPRDELDDLLRPLDEDRPRPPVDLAEPRPPEPDRFPLRLERDDRRGEELAPFDVLEASREIALGLDGHDEGRRGRLATQPGRTGHPPRTG